MNSGDDILPRLSFGDERNDFRFRENRAEAADLRRPFRLEERAPNSSRSTSRARAITSRKRPVPAAHLSFIAKFMTRPFSSMTTALLSCPPMSMSDRMDGSR